MGSRPPMREMAFLVSSALKVWDVLLRKESWSTQIGPMTPLFCNPEFPPAMESSVFLKWCGHEDVRIVQTLVDEKLPPLNSLGLEFMTKCMQYQQLQTYIQSDTKLSNRPLTEFEQLLLQEQRLAHVLSTIYKYLRPKNMAEELTCLTRCEEELETTFPSSEFLLTHKLSLSTRHQERNDKILARWYRCPVDMHKINGENQETCWSCLNARGTMSHIWYYCPKVLLFWSKIYNISKLQD